MTRNTNSVRKPFCAHCHNTGEPENVYTSHWPRSLPDRTGKTSVTCPKLRATECAYCYEFGHTRKFCPVLKANQRARESEERKMQAQQQQTSTKKQSQQKNLSIFDALRESDDEEVEVQQPVKEEWPSLSVATASVATASVATASVATANVATGYAAMAAKPAKVYNPEPQTPVGEYEVITKGARMPKSEAPPQTYSRSNVSWVDMSDDEDDEDDENW